MDHTVIRKRDSEARRAMDRWHELKSLRARHESDWEDIARLIRPQRGDFAASGLTDSRRMQKPLSSAPVMAANNFASGLYGTLTNPANKWLAMRVPDPDVGDSPAMRRWLDIVGDRILASFRPAVSPFYSAAIQLMSDISAFGNAAQYDEIRAPERKIMDVTLSLAEVCFDIDAFGRVVEVVRMFQLAPEAAIDMFGAENVPPRIIDQATKGVRDKATYYHHVKRNMDWRRGRLGPGGKEWLSIYACEVDETLCRRAGYDEMPFQAPRWEVESAQVYGTGPGFIALASARVHHRMVEANMRAGQKAADPTLLAPDRDAWPVQGRFIPGRIIHGGVNAQGQMLIRPLENNGGTGLSLEMQQQQMSDIRDAFHWTLMNLAGRTGMTATEVLQIQEEKTRLMAPHMGRIQEEYLTPKIERRFSQLLRMGQLPPPPDEARGQALEVEYTSAAAMAQKSADGAATVRLLADIGPLAQLDPRYLERISTDDTIEILHEARGVPARMLRSRDETDQIAAQRAEKQQQAEMMAMAQQGAGIAKDAATAGATMMAAQEGALEPVEPAIPAGAGQPDPPGGGADGAALVKHSRDEPCHAGRSGAPGRCSGRSDA